MVEAVFIFVYAALALLLLTRRGIYTVLALLLYLVVYDFMFLNLEAFLERPLIAAKTFSEVLIVASLVTVFVIQIRSRRWTRLDFAVMGALAVLTSTGLAFAGSEVLAALEDYRVLLAPLLLAALLSLAVRPDPTAARKLRRFLLALGALVIVIGVVQFLSYDGDMTSVWRHDFLLELKLEQDPDYQPRMLQYQIVRGDHLRASSIFISAIQFSIFSAFIGVYAFIAWLFLRHPVHLLTWLLSLVGVTVSQVRVGFIVVALGMVLAVLLGFRSRLVRLAAMLVPAFAIVAIFGYVVIGGGLNDPSTLGRIPQYEQMFREFTLSGGGFGSYKGRFDSFVIYSALTLGAGFALLLSAMVLIAVRLERVDRAAKAAGLHPESVILTRFALVQLLVALVVFTIHHTAGSVTYFLVFLVAMLAARVSHAHLEPRAAAAPLASDESGRDPKTINPRARTGTPEPGHS